MSIRNLFSMSILVLLMFSSNVAYPQAPVAKPQKSTKTEQAKPQKNRTQQTQPEHRQAEPTGTQHPPIQTQPPKREWRPINLTDKWEVENELRCYSNTASDLSVWNYHAETPENKRDNKLGFYGAMYPLPPQQSGDEYEINLSIANKNNNFASNSYEAYTSTNTKEYVSNGNYWQVVILYKTRTGQEKTWSICYNDTYSVAPRPLGSDGNPIGAESRSNATSVCVTDGFVPGSWTSTFWRDNRYITIKLADGKMTISGYVHDGQTSILDVESIILIGVGLNATAYIDASLSMKRLSYYNNNGQVASSTSNYSQASSSDYTNSNYSGSSGVEEYPYPEVLLASPGLKVTKVTIGNGYTILDFLHEGNPGETFFIKSDAYIEKDGSYNKLKLIKAEGVSTNQAYSTYVNQNGKNSFRLYFPELPKGTVKFDFSEGSDVSGATAWHIFGIKLK